MLFHYALVDDLISKEEFEQRVETKIEECGDLIDEPTAAMLVIGELGRQHVKIRELSGKSSLFSFFGKVTDKTEPKGFDRKDGEKGWVATLLVGDETGTTRVVLWDEKAASVNDIAAGDVLEIIGRPPQKSTKEIYALALRKASCEISCSLPINGAVGDSLSYRPVDLDAVLISREELRTFYRKDGTTGEMVEAVIGDTFGTARVVAWVPELFGNIPSGSSIHITGAKPDRRGMGRAYSLDEKSTVIVTDQAISVPFTPVGSVSEEGIYSIKGAVKDVKEPRSFTSRNGTVSWVRNILVSDGKDELKIVLWGEKALTLVMPGDQIEVFHATARPGRYGGIELGVGRGSSFRVPIEESHPIIFEGTIITGQGCTFIDNGTERYIIEGNLKHGTEVQVTGILSGNRITPSNVQPVEVKPQILLMQFREFIEGL
ncbi:MAG: OB-fold nucleic acid binding domain-containing protein [Methanoregula sp.]|nr:OB-fold nucleic acid binding domain-containing protein [Methanoregula sp.]